MISPVGKFSIQSYITTLLTVLLQVYSQYDIDMVDLFFTTPIYKLRIEMPMRK